MSKHKKKPDSHVARLKFVVDSINSINEWRNEAIKHMVTQEGRQDIDRKALEMRERVERAI